MNNVGLSLVGGNESATGVRRANRPDWWVVPPWPENAGVHTIVRHFLRFDPLYSFSHDKADVRAYYIGYSRALETASTHDLTCDLAWRWYHELQDCVARCVAHDSHRDMTCEAQRRVS